MRNPVRLNIDGNARRDYFMNCSGLSHAAGTCFRRRQRISPPFYLIIWRIFSENLPSCIQGPTGEIGIIDQLLSDLAHHSPGARPGFIVRSTNF
jgi:hypothetical protein